MTDHPDRDINDLPRLLDEYRRRPKDIVPVQPRPDGPPVTVGPGAYTETEIDEHGVTLTEGVAWIAPPIDRSK